MRGFQPYDIDHRRHEGSRGGRYRTPAPTSPHPARQDSGGAPQWLPRRRRRDASARLPYHNCGQNKSRQPYIMSREGSPTREVTPSSGLRGSMDSLFSKASSSIQSAAQSAAQAVQDTAQSVARSPARRRPTREENATKKPPPFFKTAAQARRAGVFPSQPNTARTVNCKFWEEPYCEGRIYWSCHK